MATASRITLGSGGANVRETARLWRCAIMDTLMEESQQIPQGDIGGDPGLPTAARCWRSLPEGLSGRFPRPAARAVDDITLARKEPTNPKRPQGAWPRGRFGLVCGAFL